MESWTAVLRSTTNPACASASKAEAGHPPSTAWLQLPGVVQWTAGLSAGSIGTVSAQSRRRQSRPSSSSPRRGPGPCPQGSRAVVANDPCRPWNLSRSKGVTVTQQSPRITIESPRPPDRLGAHVERRGCQADWPRRIAPVPHPGIGLLRNVDLAANQSSRAATTRWRSRRPATATGL